jgi:hypothetical protein
MPIYSWSRVAADNDDADTAAGADWAEGQAPSTVNNSARAMMAETADYVADLGGTLTTAGSSTAYTVTSNGSFSTLVDGARLSITMDETCGAAATLNVDGLGAKKFRKFVGTVEADLAAGDLVASGHYDIVYDTAANSAAGAWIVLNPNGQTGWRLLATKTASSSATIDFTASDFDFSTDAYDDYQVVFSQVKPASDDQYLFMRVGTGGSPTYQTSGYQWASSASGVSAAVDHGSTTDSQTTAIILTRMTTATAMVGNDTGEHVSGVVEFSNPDATDQPVFGFRTRYLAAAAGAIWSVTGAGRYASNGAITAVRFVFASGNIASGSFRLYGLRK